VACHPEALCRRCGRCCYEKLIVGRTVITTNIPCKYLDLKTRLCTVYEQRSEVNPSCIDVEQGLKMGVFPADCPYVAGIDGYVAPLDHLGPEEIEAYIARFFGRGAG